MFGRSSSSPEVVRQPRSPATMNATGGESSKELWKLAAETELRIELSSDDAESGSQSVQVTLLEGSAEVFGVPLTVWV